jgi:hypothetical protein
VATVVGGDQTRDTAELADACRGVSSTEANYYRAMHGLAGVLWLQGRATQALSVLTELLDDKAKHEQGT